MARDKNVAPTGSRLYRGLAARFVLHNGSPITNRRYRGASLVVFRPY